MGLRAGINTYLYVSANPLTLFDLLGTEEKAPVRGAACKAIEEGYNPEQDDCHCQKDAVNDLCECWKKYGKFSLLGIGALGGCEGKAYTKKSKCAFDCSLGACAKHGGSGGAS